MADPKATKPEVLPESEFNKPWEREDQYEPVRKSNDPRFGEISVFKQMWNNDIVFVKEKIVNGKNEASNDIIELKKRLALNHPNIQKLITYSTGVKKELCSTHYVFKGIYEFPHSDMQKEINEKKKNNQLFHPNDIGHLAFQVLIGLNHLHSKGVAHGDIRPIYIGFNRATNTYTILDRLIDPSPLEKLQGNNIINKKELFLSPQLFQKLQGKDKTVKFNQFKNDLFSLGLTILVVGNGQNVQDIYQPNGEIDKQKLEQHIVSFEQKYLVPNPHAVNIVRWLLKFNEEERLEAKDILARVIPYEEFKRQELYGFSQPVSYVVQSTPPVTDGGFFGNVETKISYGQPIVRTVVHSTPPPDFDVKQATTYVSYLPSENILQQTNEPVKVENKEVTYIHEPSPLVQTNPVYSYANPVYVQGTYPQTTIHAFEPIVRRSINREARQEPVTVVNHSNTEPQVTTTKYSINEKGEVVESHE